MLSRSLPSPPIRDVRSSSPPPKHNPLITGQGTVVGWSLLIVKYPCAGDGLYLVIHGLGNTELRVTAGLALLHILDFLNVHLCGLPMLANVLQMKAIS